MLPVSRAEKDITPSRQPCLQNIPTIPRFDADHATDVGGVEVKYCIQISCVSEGCVV
jgi:hypothetical protein